jgi:diguanylate cyclase (GGDEF)-like protein
VNSGPERRRANAKSERESDSLRLLDVDDDSSYAAYVAALTRRLGFDSETAGDGEAALEKLSAAHYDVAIIDQAMPRMTGVELIAKMRGDRALRSVYSVMLTASEDVQTKLDALNVGFDDFLTKSSSDLEIAAKLVAARRIASRQRTLDVTIRELYGLATRDELTGVFNRRFLLSEGERLLGEGTSLSLILFDLDGFKHINDTFGHLAGDRVLHDVGSLFDRFTRPNDLISRYGGDEFVMVVADLQAADVERVAQRLSGAVQSLRWIAGAESFSITVTTGISSSRDVAKPSMAQLLNAADSDLYRNKSLRNHPDGSTVGFVAPTPLADADIEIQMDDLLWRLDSTARPPE